VTDVVKVLSVDGGGIRGLIPSIVLAEIESRTGSPSSELFDLIAGTSTGGVIALGLTKPSSAHPEQPEFSAAELADLYKKDGARIFERSLWHHVIALDNLLDERYDSAGIEGVLEQYFGDVPLSKALTEVLVTSYELQTREPWFFARHKARAQAGWDFPMKFVARATSAAPTYFEPEAVPKTTPTQALVDGGVYANNPAMCAWVEAKKLHPGPEEVLVVSIGTGQYTRAIPYKDAKNWGLAHWAKPILDVVFDGVSDTIDHQMTVLCQESETGDPRYYRFQTELDIGSDDMDNVTKTNLAALEQKAHELIEKQTDSLDRLCAELTAKTPASVGP
jgi:patatin-like phospholipase/acyl hydrolase